jgi:hypothetical protein
VFCCYLAVFLPIYIKKKREICAVISGDKAKFVGREIFSLAVYAAPLIKCGSFSGCDG